MNKTRDMQQLLAIMARLRDPQHGCPWDVKQNFASIAPYTLEEAYEVADAIERNDYDELRLELGDLLLQVIFHAQMADEQGLFAFPDVVEGLSEKLIRRHPHVFADVQLNTESEVNRNWEAEKQRERDKKGVESKSILDHIPIGLPALTRANKLQKKAAKVGFDWDSLPPVLGKVKEELQEVQDELNAPAPSHEALTQEVGDLLFAVVNLARHLKIDPETALRGCNHKFETRFQFIESELKQKQQGIGQTSLDELESLWQKAKLSGL